MVDSDDIETQVERCTTAGIQVMDHLERLAQAADEEQWEAARHRLADVLVDAGAMQSCGMTIDRGELVRRSWELMPRISGNHDREYALNQTIHIAEALEIPHPPTAAERILDESL